MNSMSVADDSAVAEQTTESRPAVLYEVTGEGVAVITLNRPERMNAWGGPMVADFYVAIDRAEADPDVRAVVLTGSGRAFCAGADMGGLDTVGKSLENASETDVSKLVGERHPYFVTQLNIPVVVAINGACAGMGLTQALYCDVRFAAAGAKFTTAFARRGLIAEYGVSWILPRLAGLGAATDLLLSGRTFLAEEAAELGLVKEVVAPDQLMTRAIAYAADLATKCAPNSMAVIKRQLYGDALRDMFETSDTAEKLMHESMRRPDFIEGITAFFEKRPPNFPPLTV
jgi:enoyl-CoA hydratase/carnithine racemase